MPKNTAISFNFITLLSIIASGRLSAAELIIKAKADPNGTPFSIRTTATGITAAQFA